MDSTYKTNRYRLPLLEIIGVTCTGLIFSTTFAYMEVECEKSVRALERFKCLFHKHDELPKMIVTDRDLSLMNAVQIVFPYSHNLLCQFHIDKNVKQSANNM